MCHNYASTTRLEAVIKVTGTDNIFGTKERNVSFLQLVHGTLKVGHYLH